MEKIFNALVNKLSNLSPLLTFIVIVLATAMYLFKDVISKKIQDYKLRKNCDSTTEDGQYDFDDLSYHDLFSVIFEVKSAIKRYHFAEEDGGETKTRIFHDFLNIMLNEIFENMKQLIQTISAQHKAGDVSRDELKQTIRKSLNVIVDNYCMKGEHHLIDKGLTKADATYVVELFENWRSETRASINSRIDAMFASSFHTTNFQRTLAVYELISVSVSLIPKDGIRSFKEMNGKFKTIQY
jgi:hypothetical protein